MAGEPGWSSIEVGVRGFVLTAEKVHDVVIRGLECATTASRAGSGR